MKILRLNFVSLSLFSQSLMTMMTMMTIAILYFDGTETRKARDGHPTNLSSLRLNKAAHSHVAIVSFYCEMESQCGHSSNLLLESHAVPHQYPMHLGLGPIFWSIAPKIEQILRT